MKHKIFTSTIIPIDRIKKGMVLAHPTRGTSRPTNEKASPCQTAWALHISSRLYWKLLVFELRLMSMQINMSYGFLRIFSGANIWILFKTWISVRKSLFYFLRKFNLQMQLYGKRLLTSILVNLFTFESLPIELGVKVVNILISESESEGDHYIHFIAKSKYLDKMDEFAHHMNESFRK